MASEREKRFSSWDDTIFVQSNNSRIEEGFGRSPDDEDACEKGRRSPGGKALIHSKKPILAR